MKFMDKLERKFGKYAIKNLMTYIVVGNVFVFLLTKVFNTSVFVNLLSLNPYLIAKGQIWRLVTYIFIPNTFSPIWLFFELYILYLMGISLDSEWGSFRFNIYYLIGMIGTALIGFLTKNTLTASYLNLSLFLAFAYIYPNYEFMLFFILPIKVKYLAAIDWIILILTIITGSIPSKIAAAMSVLNFFVFFGYDIFIDMKHKRRVVHNKVKFRSNFSNNNGPMHKCTVCGITELDDPDMEFRYCSKCNGEYEYCMNHLYNHEHKQ